MAVLSPDDYRRASGYRRSEAQRPAQWVNRAGPVQAFTAMDIDSPVLREFLAGGRMSAAGIAVGEKLALRNSDFFRALNLISSSIGMLPTHLYRRKADGTTEKAKDHPLYRVLHKRPNGYQTAFEFKTCMQFRALLDGNAFALIIRGPRGISQLIPLKRGSVVPQLSDDWILTFKYTRPSGGTVILPARDIFHFRHPLTRDGLNGISLLDVAVNTLGLAAKVEQALGELAAKGMMAGGALETSQTLGEEAIANLRASLEEEHGGADNAGKWLILEEGLTAKPFANPKDSQSQETRQRQSEELARFTDVPRPLQMMDETAWGSGIRELGLFLVTYCLTKWFVAWEQAIERSCFTEAEQNADELYVKFNDGALLRGSLKEQAEFFSKALGNNAAWMEPNEVRSNFELNPHPDGSGLPKGVKPSPAPKDDPENE
jgi:HK97 family phage portal protein